MNLNSRTCVNCGMSFPSTSTHHCTQSTPIRCNVCGSNTTRVVLEDNTLRDYCLNPRCNREYDTRPIPQPTWYFRCPCGREFGSS